MESGVFICIIATFLQKVTGQFLDIYKKFRILFVHFYCTRALKQRALEKNRGSPVGGGIIDLVQFTSLTAGYCTIHQIKQNTFTDVGCSSQKQKHAFQNEKPMRPQERGILGPEEDWSCLYAAYAYGCQYILKKIITNKGLAAAGYFEFRNYCESPYL